MNNELISANAACPVTVRSVGTVLAPIPTRKLAYGKFEKLSSTEGIVEIEYPNTDIFSCFRVTIGRNAVDLFGAAYAFATARASDHGYELETLLTMDIR